MNLLHLLYFTCADPSLGKVDKHSISQQTLMELLIQGFTKNTSDICGDDENQKEVSKWEGLLFNDAQEITNIHWYGYGLHGSLCLQRLPLSIRCILLNLNRLSGTIDLTCLPDDLKVLDISDNAFHGSADLTNLPDGLQTLMLSANRFSGKADFSRLPASLLCLEVGSTSLEGEISHFDGLLYVEYSMVKDMRRKSENCKIGKR